MSNQTEDRVRAAIRALADEPAITASAGWEPADRPQQTPPRWVPIAAAFAVLLVLLLVVLKPWNAPPPPATSDDPPMFPREVAGLSLLTSTLSEAPLGQPAVAVVKQRDEAQLQILTQVVVIGADGRTHRRVDLAEQRGDWDVTGKLWTNAQALLSPNGRTVAIGGGRHKSAELPVLNLVTGERRDYGFAEPTAYTLKGWSPDGKRLAMVIDQKLVLLDLASGVFTQVARMSALHAAPLIFLADGRVVLQDERALVFVDQTGKVAKRVTQPDNVQGVLSGRSPDGLSLILIDSLGLHIVDAATLKESGEPFPVEETALVVGMRSPEELLLLFNSDLVAVSLRTKESIVVSSVERTAIGPVEDIDLAVDLLAKAQFVDTTPERGSLPGVVWVGLGIALALVMATVVLWRRWRGHDDQSIGRPMWTIAAVLTLEFVVLAWWADGIASWDTTGMASGIFTWVAGMAVVLVVVVALARAKGRRAAWIAGLVGAFLISSLATIAFFWSDTFPKEYDPSIDAASAPFWFVQAFVGSEELPWYTADDFGLFPHLFVLFAAIAIGVVIRQSRMAAPPPSR